MVGDVGIVVAASAAGTVVGLCLRPAAMSRLVPRRRRRPPSWLAGRPDALPLRVRVVVGLVAGLAIWGWLGAAARGLVPGAVAGAGVVGVLGFVPTSVAARRQGKLVAALPQACDLMAVCVEAGLPLRAALRAVVDVMEGPLAERLGQVTARVELGVAEREAWDDVRHEPGLEALGNQICRCLDSGTPVAKALRALAAEARRDAAAAEEVRAKRVGVRCVMPLMVCFLPSFVLLGIVPIIGGIIGNLLP